MKIDLNLKDLPIMVLSANVIESGAKMTKNAHLQKTINKA